MAEKAKIKKVNPVTAYFRETIGELRKVSWPTWPEARQLTGLVLLVMVVVGLALWIGDLSAEALLKVLLNLA